MRWCGGLAEKLAEEPDPLQGLVWPSIRGQFPVETLAHVATLATGVSRGQQRRAPGLDSIPRGPLPRRLPGRLGWFMNCIASLHSLNPAQAPLVYGDVPKQEILRRLHDEPTLAELDDAYAR